jgi:hypothetical protein
MFQSVAPLFSRILRYWRSGCHAQDHEPVHGCFDVPTTIARHDACAVRMCPRTRHQPGTRRELVRRWNANLRLPMLALEPTLVAAVGAMRKIMSRSTAASMCPRPSPDMMHALCCFDVPTTIARHDACAVRMCPRTRHQPGTRRELVRRWNANLRLPMLALEPTLVAAVGAMRKIMSRSTAASMCPRPSPDMMHALCVCVLNQVQTSCYEGDCKNIQLCETRIACAQ